MIHRLSLRTAYILFNHQLIDFDDIDFAAYYFENGILKVIGCFLTVIVAVITDSFPGLMVFYVFYSMLRKYSGGFHCSTQLRCLLLSAITLFVIVIVKTALFDNINYFCGGVHMLSSLIILIFGTVNHPNLDLNERELALNKRKARLVVTFELSVILLAILMHVRSEYVFYMSMGITVNAISMIVAKLSGQEVTTHEGKD